MSLRAFILHNFWLKLFSLLLATLIWFAIHFWVEGGNRQPQNPITNQITRQLFRLPVRVLTKPGDERVFKVDPPEVSVSVTGEAAVLRDLTPKNISVYVDVANIRSSRETNQQVKVDVPKEITVDVVPRTVNVEQVSR
jgi:YbbR domain-containing protein